MRTALCIGESDPTANNGIQADLKTYLVHDVNGVCAVGSISVQNTRKVSSVYALTASLLREQLRALFDDIAIDAVKVGLLTSVAHIEVVAEVLSGYASTPMVLDPVMQSKSGYGFITAETREALVRELFPLAEVVTPNLYEAEELTNSRIESLEDMKRAASEIVLQGAHKVVLKTGRSAHETTDVIFDGWRVQVLEGPRIRSGTLLGSGAAFSAALTANLALGKKFSEAVALAKKYVTQGLEHAIALGKGAAAINHSYRPFSTDSAQSKEHLGS
jgi:hydroxymethylpyrimidine/phosphomethylpyrimidine kinase